MTTKNHGLRVGAAAALLGAIFASGAVSANQLTLVYGSHHGPGGEFLATTDNGWSASIAANYADEARGTYNHTLGFETFCLEKDEYFRPGSPNNYELNGSSTALNGGRNTNNGDRLSVASGFLYKMFATGGLTTYGYNSDTRAQELQNAFWTLENEHEITIASWLQDVLHGEFGGASALSDWRADSGPSLSNDVVMSATSYGVDVVNLGNRSTNFQKQDQLVYLGTATTLRVPDGGTTQPVPDGGTTLALLGITLGAIGVARRKLRRTAS